MKRLGYLLIFLAWAGALNASFDDPKGPSIRSNAIHLFDSEISGPGVPKSAGQELSASRVQVEGLGGFPIFEKSAVLLGLGYGGLRLDWAQNPHFTQDWFHTVTVSTGLYSKLIKDWRWLAIVGVKTNIENGTFDSATMWRGILWGKYYWRDNVNLHIGVIAAIGMHKNNWYPLAGFDWRINEEWEIDLVFPMQMGVNYFISENWVASVRAQFLSERHRLKGNEPMSSGIFEYRMIGGELALTYKREDPRLSIGALVGYSGDVQLKVWNSSGGAKTKYNIDNGVFVGFKGKIEFPYNK